MSTRRDFLKSLAVGGSAAAIATGAAAATAPQPLIAAVQRACGRLAGQGWRDLLLKATRNALDIAAADLGTELAKTVEIDRGVAGFAELAPQAVRGIEPGQPAASLLYHAFASAAVVEDGAGAPLKAFPTLAEIEAVENYVYGVRPPSVADLRARAGDSELGVVVFALDYRSARDSVQGRHADLGFSRVGIARMGNIAPRYGARERQFEPLDPVQPFAFRVIPQRFAAFIAMRAKGDAKRFGPQDFQPGDDSKDFWVPLHKLFAGPECLAGQVLQVELSSHLQNEKLRRFHRFLEINGHRTDWRGADLSRFPFLIRDAMIGQLSRRPNYGSGVLEPTPSPFVTRARYRDQWLTFEVPESFVKIEGAIYVSSLQILPGDIDRSPAYESGLSRKTDRSAPEYLSIRHRVREDGTLEDLNRRPDMWAILRKGGYRAQHFIDFAGDGWIEARCPQLAREIRTWASAYALVSPPDFFPLVSQRELALWWQTEVAETIRAALWAIPPYALSQTRMAANITLDGGFSIWDDTVTAIVARASEGQAPVVPLPPPGRGRYSGLPDSSPGVFDPGWDASQGVHFFDSEPNGNKPYLQSFGLGTPFVEDVKLCAALGSYWPAIAPNSSRTFTPYKRPAGFHYPWPTIVPLTDEEIGVAPTAGGAYLPWDGVRGPQLVTIEGRQVVAYPDIERTDYLTTRDRITAALTAKVDLPETKARVLAMASVYWSLGIHDPDYASKSGVEENTAVIEILKAKGAWAVLSFRAVAAGDAGLQAAEQAAAGGRLGGARKYRLHLYLPGEEARHPTDLMTVLVGLKEQVVAYADGEVVLLRRGDGPWQRDASMPKS